MAVWDMEGRLGVGAAFRFPLFQPLMWHVAKRFLPRIQAALEYPPGDDVITVMILPPAD